MVQIKYTQKYKEEKNDKELQETMKSEEKKSRVKKFA